MSITSGLVDTHHEMELAPSTRRITSTWFARHLWLILLAGIGAALFIAL